MWLRQLIGAMLLAVSLSLNTAYSQDYPIKPVRIVTGEVGAGNDFVARLIARGLTINFGRQVIVDNRSTIAMEIAMKASPDGYTLISYGSPLWLMPFMRENVPWDPIRDFSPITLLTRSPNVLVVYPSLPADSVKDLISMAKARPGELNYGSGPSGSTPHLAGELFNSLAGVNIVRVPFKGSGPALNALIGGQLQLSFPVAAGAAPLVRAGRLRALAVTSAQPSPFFPGLPSIATTVPGYESEALVALFAPAKTPMSIIHRINIETVRVLNVPETKDQFLRSGVEPVGSTPEQTGETIKSEMTRIGSVIKRLGIRSE